MSWLDWLVLGSTLIFIVVYGIYKTYKQNDIESYLKGNNSIPWYMVGFSIMATQASAITFLSAPGQAFEDGMRFVQFYFGLPIAMVILSVTVIPIYHKLNIYTAYQYLETRFDLKTRSLAAFLFLIQRGLAAGLTIYAPAIILSSILGWNIFYTNIIIGLIVIVYTVTGGTKAVSITQQWQMAIILLGMVAAAFLVADKLPHELSFKNMVAVAGVHGKINIIDTHFDLNNKYNLWSGLIGGLFLALSYFGTDQSQVSRYISGKSVFEIRLGLLMNGLIKIPMQFFILFIGVMLFVYFQFNKQPIFFNEKEITLVKTSEYAGTFNSHEETYNMLQEKKIMLNNKLVQEIDNKEQKVEIIKQINALNKEQLLQRNLAINQIKKANPAADENDTNYIFLSYVLKYFPHGFIGLLIAVMFAASMSSTSSELNALAGTFVIDIYKRNINKNGTDKHYVNISKVATFAWGIFAIAVAEFANRLGSLIEAVNQLGSLFYGTILGIFLSGFYINFIKGSAAFYSALLSQVIILLLSKYTNIGFLWFNLLGCLLVISFGLMISAVQAKNKKG